MSEQAHHPHVTAESGDLMLIQPSDPRHPHACRAHHCYVLDKAAHDELLTIRQEVGMISAMAPEAVDQGYVCPDDLRLFVDRVYWHLKDFMDGLHERCLVPQKADED